MCWAITSATRRSIGEKGESSRMTARATMNSGASATLVPPVGRSLGLLWRLEEDRRQLHVAGQVQELRGRAVVAVTLGESQQSGGQAREHRGLAHQRRLFDATPRR